jgi:tripartite-type tricarboxylate transporter receptor subunit TctC
MNPNRRHILQAGSAWAALGASGAFAQAPYPARPIQLVVPFAPGGGNDVLARLIAAPLAAQLGQPVLVDNKPGAGGNIGAQLVARATPDGHTLLLASNTLTINPYLIKNIPFDVVRDFAPVARIANQSLLIVVNPAVPAKNVAELVAYLKANPGKVSYASPGNGTPHHFAAEMFKQVAGVEMLNIAYRGASPALTDLISGQVQVMFASIISALPFIKEGRIRVLATAEGRRLSALKDVPTVKESGYPAYEATVWGGVLAPAAIPAPVLRKLADTLLRVAAMPETVAQLPAGLKNSASRYEPTWSNGRRSPRPPGLFRNRVSRAARRRMMKMHCSRCRCPVFRESEEPRRGLQAPRRHCLDRQARKPENY